MFNRFKKYIISAIAAFLIITSTFVTAAARGGGGSSGGSGGSGGGSGGGGSSSSYSRDYYGDTNRRSRKTSNPLSVLLFAGIIVINRKRKRIICYFNLFSIRYKVRAGINTIKSKESNYVYNNLMQNINEAYFNLQEAWTKRDIRICEHNLTKDLYSYYKSKLEWMVVKHELNVLVNVRLLQAVPVSVKHYRDYNMDEIWVFIKGRMKDYTLNEITAEVIDGSKQNKSFIEFWQFKVNNDRWVLNKILQEDEFDFKNCDVFIENGDNELLKDK